MRLPLQLQAMPLSIPELFRQFMALWEMNGSMWHQAKKRIA
jgi:hypothetical protein